MASQPIFPSYTPVPFPAPKPNVRVAFIAGEAVQAINAPGAVDAKAHNATLEEIALGEQARELIDTARQVLSPHVYRDFLAWGEAATYFSTKWHDDADEEGDARCARTNDAIESLTNASALNVHDLAFKAYILNLEMSDSSCAGPLEPARDPFHGSVAQDLLEAVHRDFGALSPLPRMVDRLATRAWELSGGGGSWTVPVGTAITDAFTAARKAEREPRTYHGVVLGGPSSGYDPFMRGPLIAWNRAYERWQESRGEADRYYWQTYRPLSERWSEAGEKDSALTAEHDAAEKVQEQLWDAESDDRIALCLLPAPGPAELAVKIDIFNAYRDFELTQARQITQQFAADARRFGRLGAYPQADAPILDAFKGLRSDMTAWLEHGSRGTEEDAAADDRIAALEKQLWSHRAHTVEGVIAKLRVLFTARVEAGWADHAQVDPRHPAFVAGIGDDGDFIDRMQWQAIEDLARIAGVNLAE